MLLGLGYTNVVDQRAGFLGAEDPFGKASEPGWQPKGLPVTPGTEPGRSWDELAKKAGK